MHDTPIIDCIMPTHRAFDRFKKGVLDLLRLETASVEEISGESVDGISDSAEAQSQAGANSETWEKISEGAKSEAGQA